MVSPKRKTKTEIRIQTYMKAEYINTELKFVSMQIQRLIIISQIINFLKWYSKKIILLQRVTILKKKKKKKDLII